MEPQLRFCTSADGTRIAYHTLGEGRPIVSVPPWLADGEKDMERPEARALTESLAEGRRFVWFDRRGVGASQRDVDDVSLEAQVADLIAVIDSLNLERFDLIALEDGAAVSVTYAAQHPEQVSRMVFWAPTIYGADVATTETFRSLIDLIRSNWSLARRSMAAFSFPNGPVEEQRWLSRYIREAVSAEIAAKYLDLIAGLDVRPAAALVSAPVLILHRRGQRSVPLVAGRGAAAAIPNA
ncbi:MAG: alpha/beta hydrolase, partial [Chloroflexi bacterium]|nr:alpha/beta hydrolase [Chloroflexota bacterium]